MRKIGERDLRSALARQGMTIDQYKSENNLKTVRAVDALLLISISHNGNGQEAPPSGIFRSQQLVPHPQVACPRAKRHARECKQECNRSRELSMLKRNDAYIQLCI